MCLICNLVFIFSQNLVKALTEEKNSKFFLLVELKIHKKNKFYLSFFVKKLTEKKNGFLTTLT